MALSKGAKKILFKLSLLCLCVSVVLPFLFPNSGLNLKYILVFEIIGLLVFILLTFIIRNPTIGLKKTLEDIENPNFQFSELQIESVVAYFYFMRLIVAASFLLITIFVIINEHGL